MFHVYTSDGLVDEDLTAESKGRSGTYLITPTVVLISGFPLLI